MKTGRDILLFSLLTLTLLALVSCRKKAEEEENEVSEELIIKPMVGIGEVQFGMSKDEIIEHFGQPAKVSVMASGTKLNYVASKGLGFEVDSELGLQKIQCWSESWPTQLPFAVANCSGITQEGIGIGSTKKEIVAAYGEPDRTSTDTNKGVIHGLEYDKLRIEFALWQDKLISMILEAPK